MAKYRAKLKRLQLLRDRLESIAGAGRGVFAIDFATLNDPASDRAWLAEEACPQAAPNGVVLVPSPLDPDLWSRLARDYCRDLQRRVDAAFADV